MIPLQREAVGAKLSLEMFYPATPSLPPPTPSPRNAPGPRERRDDRRADAKDFSFSRAPWELLVVPPSPPLPLYPFELQGMGQGTPAVPVKSV